jgi:hypothetical protein
MAVVWRNDMSAVVKLGDVSNAAKDQIELSEPYMVRIQLTGAADLLLHRWNNEAVAEKGAARKGSAVKKTDNVESYVYRNEAGFICMPGEYARGSIVNAAKFRQDPRSPRKSAMDLFKAAIISMTPLSPILAAKTGKPTKEWDFEDRRRVMVQRNGITRVRPAMRSGWKVDMDFLINLPEYVDQAFFREVLGMAGKLIGVGDFRPTYGRFDLTHFKKL